MPSQGNRGRVHEVGVRALHLPATGQVEGGVFTRIGWHVLDSQPPPPVVTRDGCFPLAPEHWHTRGLVATGVGITLRRVGGAAVSVDLDVRGGDVDGDTTSYLDRGFVSVRTEAVLALAPAEFDRPERHREGALQAVRVGGRLGGLLLGQLQWGTLCLLQDGWSYRSEVAPLSR